MQECKHEKYKLNEDTQKMHNQEAQPSRGTKRRDGEHITKTRLFKYTENFTTKKMKIFR